MWIGKWSAKEHFWICKGLTFTQLLTYFFISLPKLGIGPEISPTGECRKTKQQDWALQNKQINDSHMSFNKEI